MYALPNNSQHKLIVKVRGGISQLPAITAVQNTATSSPTFSSSPSSPSPSQPIFHRINQHGNNKYKSPSHLHRAQKQFITPEHDEMIKYVQQSWKGVERDYKKSVNSVVNNLDLAKKKKTAGASKPLLLSGSYHHSSVNTTAREDSFRPFDLEAFWGNRILKRLTDI